MAKKEGQKKKKVVDKVVLKQMTRWLQLFHHFLTFRLPNCLLEYLMFLWVFMLISQWCFEEKLTLCCCVLILICMKLSNKLHFDSKESTQKAKKVQDVQAQLPWIGLRLNISWPQLRLGGIACFRCQVFLSEMMQKFSSAESSDFLALVFSLSGMCV